MMKIFWIILCFSAAFIYGKRATEALSTTVACIYLLIANMWAIFAVVIALFY